jgi:hypothetical protein
MGRGNLKFKKSKFLRQDVVVVVMPLLMMLFTFSHSCLG